MQLNRREFSERVDVVRNVIIHHVLFTLRKTLLNCNTGPSPGLPGEGPVLQSEEVAVTSNFDKDGITLGETKHWHLTIGIRQGCIIITTFDHYFMFKQLY